MKLWPNKPLESAHLAYFACHFTLTFSSLQTFLWISPPTLRIFLLRYRNFSSAGISTPIDFRLPIGTTIWDASTGTFACPTCHSCVLVCLFCWSRGNDLQDCHEFHRGKQPFAAIIKVFFSSSSISDLTDFRPFSQFISHSLHVFLPICKPPYEVKTPIPILQLVSPTN